MTGSHRSWRAAVVVVAVSVAAVLAFVACVEDPGPSVKDVLPEAYLVYPGAQEVKRIWSPEERGHGIDGNDLSHGASLTLSYSVPPGTPKVDVDRWYDERLLDRGWALHADTGAMRTYQKQVGDRVHWYDVTTHAAATTSDLTIAYTISLKE